MRHDIDKNPKNALKIAQLENRHNVKASYYFRTIDSVFDQNIMKQIADLGHEIGYHYEDLSLCKGNYESAIERFGYYLERFREIFPVKTICMHGSPLSKYDNRKIWKKYDYRDFGIIAEPYLDIDFNEVFYITDTGRLWNNEKASVRDKVSSGFDIKINSTQHLIELIKMNQLPDKIMINTHPHRWFDFGFGWTKELIFQSIKNVIKSGLIKYIK